MVRYFVFLLVISFNHFVSAGQQPVQKEILSSLGNEIEYFILKPKGDGPFPVIFLLHGYQPFVSLVLGKKDSFLRLHVQHFDLTCEEVILQRN